MFVSNINHYVSELDVLDDLQISVIWFFEFSGQQVNDGMKMLLFLVFML